ncbi:FG-GAP repeat domain-containing protein [Flavobacterium limi]|uniref:Repeat domain-containing protein n=1 Tax=Flavobacterium limi TaxID=2045105 RepID=A0ABQ1TXH7_9FLAO|nr:VCBS repeat-containing protein [Flavobacterium limi]GGF03827.1 hypothetical protein GCM10011518_11230 [Flavobacterium limi]
MEQKNAFAATTITSNKLNQFQSIVNPSSVNNLLNFNVYNLINNTTQLSYVKSFDTQKDPVVIRPETLIYDDYTPHAGNSDFFNPVTPFEANYYEGDFNGDGISEVFIIRPTVEYHKETTYYYWNNEESYEIRAVIDSQEEDVYLADLNSNSSVNLGSKEFVKLLVPSQLKLATSRGRGNYVADFNGDGKSDLLNIDNYNGSYMIFSFKQLNVSPWVELEVIGSGTIDKYSVRKQTLFGDYNGDGKTDIMLPDSEGGSGQTLWHIYYSNPKPAGGEFFVKESHNIVEYWPNTGSHYDSQVHISNYYAMDINKDGKSDIVRVWRRYYKPKWTINDHNTEWWVKGYTNKIGDTTSAITFPMTYDSKNDNLVMGQPSGFFSDSPDIPIPLVSNYRYNGANTDLVIVRGHYNKIEYYQFNKDFDKDNRLKIVTEANGKITQTIDYLPMEASNGMLGNSSTDFYSSADAVNYPNVEIIRNSGSYLVSKLTAAINGVSKYQDFRYRGYVSNFNYGTVGFTRTTRSS